ncbi:hypothetical protein [Streptomyces sp. NPDC002640]
MFAAHVTITYWWIAAIVSGLALVFAVMSLTPGPKKLRWWLTAVAAAVVPGLALAVKTADMGAETGLAWYIMITLALAAQRLIFARWWRRRMAASEAEQSEPISRGQTAIACLSIVGTAAGIIALLTAITEPV